MVNMLMALMVLLSGQQAGVKFVDGCVKGEDGTCAYLIVQDCNMVMAEDGSGVVDVQGGFKGRCYVPVTKEDDGDYAVWTRNAAVLNAPIEPIQPEEE